MLLEARLALQSLLLASPIHGEAEDDELSGTSASSAYAACSVPREYFMEADLCGIGKNVLYRKDVISGIQAYTDAIKLYALTVSNTALSKTMALTILCAYGCVLRA